MNHKVAVGTSILLFQVLHEAALANWKQKEPKSIYAMFMVEDKNHHQDFPSFM